MPTSKLTNVKQNTTSNSVWTQGSSKQLFKNVSKPSVQQQKATLAETEKRKKFIPSPDCFPEGMREVLKARQLGLPDPLVEPVAPSQADLFEEMKKKAKKRKVYFLLF